MSRASSVHWAADAGRRWTETEQAETIIIRPLELIHFYSAEPKREHDTRSARPKNAIAQTRDDRWAPEAPAIAVVQVDYHVPSGLRFPDHADTVPAEIAGSRFKAILESPGIVRSDACARQIGFRRLVFLEPTRRLRATLRY